jgi:hypothetical protein
MAMLRDPRLLVPSRDMFHLCRLPQWNSVIGSSRLSMVRQSIGLSVGRGEYQARFVGQAARTGGLLSTDQKFASKEIREQFRDEWQRLKAGPRNVTLTQKGCSWTKCGRTGSRPTCVGRSFYSATMRP